MQGALVLVLGLAALVVVGGAAWTVLDATVPTPGRLPAATEGLELPMSLRPEPVLLAPDPAPGPAPDPGPEPQPDPDPLPATPPAAVPPNQTAAIDAARREHCTTPGWPCRSYSWEFRGTHFWLVLEMDQGLYDDYRAGEKPMRLRATSGGFAQEPAYDLYVSDPRDDVFVGRVATELRRLALDAGFDETDELSFALSFVHGLRYTPDNVSTSFDEYPRYPVETLVDDGGDCEDTSILFASLVLALGHDAILVSPPEHMAVGVAGDLDAGAGVDIGSRHYLYAETTGDGWPIGTIPPEDAGQPMTTWHLRPAPLFTLSESSAVSEGSGLRATATVTNVGTIAGSGQMAVELRNAQGLVYSAAVCPVTDLDRSAQQVCTAVVDAQAVPQGQAVRLEIRAEGGGLVHDALATSMFVPWP